MASKSKPSKEGKGKGKDKDKSKKDDVLCTNTPNCGRRGHTKDQCWEKGGGNEGQALDWWKKSKGKKTSANSAEAKTDEKDGEPEDYAEMVALSQYQRLKSIYASSEGTQTHTHTHNPKSTKC